jgi:hypothetical protein
MFGLLGTFRIWHGTFLVSCPYARMLLMTASPFNQTIVYPGDSWVMVPSRSGSLCRKASMMDLSEEFESATGWAKCHGSARTPLGTHANGEDSGLEESRKAICT